MTYGIAWLPIETSHLVSDLTSLKATEVEKANTRQKNGTSKKCSFRLVFNLKMTMTIVDCGFKSKQSLFAFIRGFIVFRFVWCLLHTFKLSVVSRFKLSITSLAKKTNKKRARHKSCKPVFLKVGRKIDRLWFLYYSVLVLHVLPWTTKNWRVNKKNPLKFHNPLPNR